MPCSLLSTFLPSLPWLHSCKLFTQRTYSRLNACMNIRRDRIETIYSSRLQFRMVQLWVMQISLQDDSGSGDHAPRACTPGLHQSMNSVQSVNSGTGLCMPTSGGSYRQCRAKLTHRELLLFTSQRNRVIKVHGRDWNGSVGHGSWVIWVTSDPLTHADELRISLNFYS